MFPKCPDIISPSSAPLEQQPSLWYPAGLPDLCALVDQLTLAAVVKTLKPKEHTVRVMCPASIYRDDM